MTHVQNKAAGLTWVLTFALLGGFAWRAQPAFTQPVGSTLPAAGAPISSGSWRSAQPPAPTPMQDRLVVPAAIEGAIRLNQMWRFHTGDDPAWADPNYDDSKWDKVNLTTPLSEQGIETYSGYGWYRLRLHPVPLPESGKLALSALIVPYSIGQMQVLANGLQVGHTQGIRDDANVNSLTPPTMYQSRPFTVPISQVTADGSVVVAIRSWADAPISHGLLDHVELGDSDSVEAKSALEQVRQWDQNVLAGILVSFLFFSVSVLGATLYLAQRNHSEYLWLSLLCLSVTVSGGVETAFSASYMPLPLFQVLNLWTGRIFMAITLEFVLRFTASDYRKLMRGVQIAVLVLPLTWFLPTTIFYDAFYVSSEFVFTGLISFMLYRAWRRGRTEAGRDAVPVFSSGNRRLDRELRGICGRQALAPDCLCSSPLSSRADRFLLRYHRVSGVPLEPYCRDPLPVRARQPGRATLCGGD